MPLHFSTFDQLVSPTMLLESLNILLGSVCGVYSPSERSFFITNLKFQPGSKRFLSCFLKTL